MQNISPELEEKLEAAQSAHEVYVIMHSIDARRDKHELFAAWERYKELANKTPIARSPSKPDTTDVKTLWAEFRNTPTRKRVPNEPPTFICRLENPFALEPQPAAQPKPPAPIDNNDRNQQAALFSGLGCLPGQKNLFEEGDLR